MEKTSKNKETAQLGIGAVSGSSIRQTALTWWDDLELEEKEKIEREFGYYGHDIGTTQDDVVYFYTEKLKNCR